MYSKTRSSKLSDAGCYVCYQPTQYLIIFIPRKNSLPSVLIAWLCFYWINLAYMNRMPLTACQISFNFYDHLKIVKFSSRTKSFSPSRTILSIRRNFWPFYPSDLDKIWSATQSNSAISIVMIYYRSIHSIWINLACTLQRPICMHISLDFYFNFTFFSLKYSFFVLSAISK